MWYNDRMNLIEVAMRGLSVSEASNSPLSLQLPIGGPPGLTPRVSYCSIELTPDIKLKAILGIDQNPNPDKYRTFLVDVKRVVDAINLDESHMMTARGIQKVHILTTDLLGIVGRGNLNEIDPLKYTDFELGNYILKCRSVREFSSESRIQHPRIHGWSSAQKKLVELAQTQALQKAPICLRRLRDTPESVFVVGQYTVVQEKKGALGKGAFSKVKLVQFLNGNGQIAVRRVVAGEKRPYQHILLEKISKNVPGIVQMYPGSEMHYYNKNNTEKWAALYELYDGDFEKLPKVIAPEQSIEVIKQLLLGAIEFSKYGVHADIKQANCLFRIRNGEITAVFNDFDSFVSQEHIPYIFINPSEKLECFSPEDREHLAMQYKLCELESYNDFCVKYKLEDQKILGDLKHHWTVFETNYPDLARIRTKNHAVIPANERYDVFRFSLIIDSLKGRVGNIDDPISAELRDKLNHMIQRAQANFNDRPTFIKLHEWFCANIHEPILKKIDESAPKRVKSESSSST